MMKKAIVCIFVCILMIVSTIVLVSGTTILKKTSQPLTMGNTLYVGGSGSNNYTKIQDAINDASEGDTVYVYDDSSPYYENLVVNKSINLIGEERNLTIIDGRNGSDVIYINSNNVTIRGFSIQHEVEPSHLSWCGVCIKGNDCTIEGNIIQKNQEGVFIGNGPSHSINPKGHNILNNIIRNNHNAGIIAVIGAINFTISGNIIEENGNSGISIANIVTSGNQIIHNTIISNNYYGIFLNGTFNNITENTIQNHVHGKWRGTGILVSGINNNITRNNLLNNTIQGKQKNDGALADIFTLLKLNNVWDENYWGEPLSEPERISGLFTGEVQLKKWPFPLDIFWFPWPAYDSHPAQEPYDI